MKILALDSSSLVASVAIWADGRILAEYSINYKKTHSQTLLPMLAEVLKMLDLELKEVDAVAVCQGPGSFTGLRIGIASAKGLALGLDKPIVAVPTLDAMAYNIFKSPALICGIMDARRNQVYNALHKNNDNFECVEASRAISIEELVAELNSKYAEEELIFIGDGVDVYRTYVEENLKNKYSFAPAHMDRQRAGSLASLAAIYYSEGNFYNPAENFEVLYLRKSQAERERDEALRQRI